MLDDAAHGSQSVQVFHFGLGLIVAGSGITQSVQTCLRDTVGCTIEGSWFNSREG
jgi:hypothetical protein